ncbi:MAG: LysR family transcriptional regulator [Planctomycetaceae bacterium]|nr:LysR family transcriptional regulator [Planctomycetaceae bacterium]
MIDELTVEEMRQLVAIGEIFAENQGEPMPLGELWRRLKDRGFRMGNGMSREMDDLERKVSGAKSKGKSLLVRGRKGSQLTPAGAIICESFRTIVEQISELQVNVRTPRPTVRIGLTNSLTTNMFPRVLQETNFFERFPDVDLEFVEAEPHQLTGLLQSKVDFAVGPKDVTDGHPSHALCEWKRVLMYSRHQNYVHDFSQPCSLETLREWLRDECVMVPSSMVIPRLEQFLKPMRKGRLMRVPQAAVRRVWVERGLGVAISHEEKRTSDWNESIGTIDLSEKLGTAEMHLYQHRRRKLSPPARDLIDQVIAIFQRENFPHKAR